MKLRTDPIPLALARTTDELRQHLAEARRWAEQEQAWSEWYRRAAELKREQAEEAA